MQSHIDFVPSVILQLYIGNIFFVVLGFKLRSSFPFYYLNHTPHPFLLIFQVVSHGFPGASLGPQFSCWVTRITDVPHYACLIS
jgi:hypothetical protein